MKNDLPAIPYKISEYIQDHFMEDFLFAVKDVKQIKGATVYTVEVTKDDYIHTLTFNEAGNLIEESSDKAFPPDIHDEFIGADIPE
jgi:hypothetical protein